MPDGSSGCAVLPWVQPQYALSYELLALGNKLCSGAQLLPGVCELYLWFLLLLSENLPYRVSMHAHTQLLSVSTLLMYKLLLCVVGEVVRSVRMHACWVLGIFIYAQQYGRQVTAASLAVG